MKPNPVLKKLGLSDDDRVVIFHADDIGMSQASLAAYIELVDFGLLSSATAMVPCPWFPATAAFCREGEGGKIDMGVHLTLTSEWDGFRWGPISTRDPASGLMDEEGHFHRTSKALEEHGDPAFVKNEIEAQVQRAVDSGIDVTHIDSHMGSIFSEKFSKDYYQLSQKYPFPITMWRLVAPQ